MIKVMTVFGTRPEAIKMAPLIKELEKNEKIKSVVCVTAQHREMLDQVLKAFSIIPDYDLNIMKLNQTIASITTDCVNLVYDVIGKEKPDMVLVHGDTSTTFSSALACFYTKTKLGHVEAGLRTYDKYSPFPEEMNRQLTTRIADIHFAPTQGNKKALLKEDVKENIYITGNTVIDALNYTVSEDYDFHNEKLKDIIKCSEKLIVLTAHRRENLGEPLENIFKAINKLINKNKDIRIVYPVHLNPLVVNTAKRILGETERVHLIEPLDVLDMHNLISKCHLVMTDSGGLQEEAPAFGKPVVVLREETERPEAVDAGTVVIAGTDAEKVFSITDDLLNNQNQYKKMAFAVNPYGDGKASERIVKSILHFYGQSNKPNEFI